MNKAIIPYYLICGKALKKEQAVVNAFCTCCSYNCILVCIFLYENEDVILNVNRALNMSLSMNIHLLYVWI